VRVPLLQHDILGSAVSNRPMRCGGLAVVLLLIGVGPCGAGDSITAKLATWDPVAQQYSATPVTYQGSCPTTVKFEGSITALAGGRVQYRFLRSDNAQAAAVEATLKPGKSLTLQTSWTLFGNYSGWVQLEVVAPHAVRSELASFKLICGTAGTVAGAAGRAAGVGTAAGTSTGAPQPAGAVRPVPSTALRPAGPAVAAAAAETLRRGRFFVAGDDSGLVNIFNREGTVLLSFNGNYTPRDGFAVGDVNGDGMDEILIAGDDSGRVDVFNQAGDRISWFKGGYTVDDGFAIGDVNGDGVDEILIAGDDSGRIDLFNWKGEVVRPPFNARFTKNDAFCCGDVNSDGKDEILVFGDSSGRLDVFDFAGGKLASHETGMGETDPDAIPYAAMGVGDVNRDGAREVIVAFEVGEKRRSWCTTLFSRGTGTNILSATGALMGPVGNFTQKDGFAVGDVNDDGFAEVVVAGDRTGAVEVFNGEGRQIMSFVAKYTKNDGFAVARHR